MFYWLYMQCSVKLEKSVLSPKRTNMKTSNIKLIESTKSKIMES